MAIEPSLQFRDNQAGIELAAGFAPARGRFSPREAMNAVGVAERRAKPTGDFRLKRRSATRGWFWTWLRGLKPTATFGASLREAASQAARNSNAPGLVVVARLQLTLRGQPMVLISIVKLGYAGEANRETELRVATRVRTSVLLGQGIIEGPRVFPGSITSNPITSSWRIRGERDGELDSLANIRHNAYLLPGTSRYACCRLHMISAARVAMQRHLQTVGNH